MIGPRVLVPDVVVPTTCSVGEGPLWDPQRHAIWWVDALDGIVHAYELLSGRALTWQLGQSVACLVLHENGAIGLGMREGFGILDPSTGASRLVAPIEPLVAHLRLNDGKTDGSGRWWAGTMTDPPTEGSGTLYRLGDDARLTVVLRGLTISNGLGWSPDHRVMYLIDSATGCLDAFDFDLSDGEIANRRTVARVEAGVGVLDGLAVDEEGCIWVAIWGAGEVRCFSPLGEHLRSVMLPASAASSCAFGGHDLSTLFVTTARYQEPAERLALQPHAGAVFAVDAGVRGMPVSPWVFPAEVAEPTLQSP